MKAQGLEYKGDTVEPLKKWRESAKQTFKEYGSIVKVYRERGFLVVHFADAKSASNMFNKCCSNGSFNDVPFVYMKIGTPTKKDKQTCEKQCMSMQED